jgi:hypothetical protein
MSSLIEDRTLMRLFWDADTRIMSMEWKDATSAMTDEDFKGVLTELAGWVEDKRPLGLLIDVRHFRHRPGPGILPWRLEHISPRYNAAGVTREAFVFPSESEAPPMGSAEGEAFVTRSFNSRESAIAWLNSP